MDYSFWHSAWEEGRTHFHQGCHNEKMIQFFPKNPHRAPATVLVPLCGKSSDMMWLAHQGYRVIGVEIVESAVQDFFTDNALGIPDVTRMDHFTVYTLAPFQLWVGDFFKFVPPRPIDYVYDRASIVALPNPLRHTYAHTMTRILQPGSQLFMLTFDYDQALITGPPFSVTHDEIDQLFGRHFDITIIELSPLVNENPRLMAIPGIRNGVYSMKKRDT